MKPVQYQTYDRFYDKARDLRKTFDQKFANPLQTASDRFVWDYWHVPGEYTLLRTPAVHYFPRRVYERFHRHLVEWGRLQLGCHDISPPWLSCYIEGCRQEPHQDVPHGPLAFVYSLTAWKQRSFSGGETFIKMTPPTLVKPEFNRLLVFNPALTHGVRQVKGTHDPRFGRLVIHGWFVNPRPFWVGPLRAEEVKDSLDEGLEKSLDPRWKLGSGLLSLRLQISPSGEVQRVQVLFDTLSRGSEKQKTLFCANLKHMKFPRKTKPTSLTLPLQFRV